MHRRTARDLRSPAFFHSSQIFLSTFARRGSPCYTKPWWGVGKVCAYRGRRLSALSPVFLTALSNLLRTCNDGS